MEVIDEGWVACGRDVSSRSLPGRVSCGSVGLQRAVVVQQQLQCRLNLSLGALSKDMRHSLCVGTTNNTEGGKKRGFSVQMQKLTAPRKY